MNVNPTDLKVIGVTHYDSPTGEGIDFFLSTTRWTGKPYPRSECDDLRWCLLSALPENTIPFVRRAIEHHLRAGLWFDEIGWQEKTTPLQANETGEESSTEHKAV